MQSTTGTDTTFKFTTTGWNDWTDLKIDHWLCLIGMLQARLETDDLEGLRISLEKDYFVKRGTLEIGVFVWWCVLLDSTFVMEKLRELDDRSRPNNVWTDGIPETSNETWKSCEEEVIKIIKKN